MSEQENFNLDEVISGEKKIEYVDKLELLREKVNSKSVLSSRSNKKELIEIVENLKGLASLQELNDKRQANILLDFSRSENLWIRRISIVSTLTFIKNNEFNQTLKIANILIYDDHDLIHKAVGWMLREVYKRDEDLIKRFLRQNYAQIPRTTLRYAIERMDKEERLSYLKGNFDVSQR